MIKVCILLAKDIEYLQGHGKRKTTTSAKRLKRPLSSSSPTVQLFQAPSEQNQEQEHEHAIPPQYQEPEILKTQQQL